MNRYFWGLPVMDQAEYQAKCLLQLQQSVAALGGDAHSPILVETAELIIRSMTGPWRSFHTPEHIFDVGRGGAPVEVIAALFHDLVYVQVDQGIHVNLSRYISPCVREVGQVLVIEPVQEPGDSVLEMLLTVFGFAPGHKLSPFAGQNEFLSALVAVRVLQPLLSFDALMQIAACIEATVPFRGPSAEGRSCSDLLQERLLQVSQRNGLGLDDASSARIVERCVRVANRDIDNFASENPADFLNNTWNLIPETNHELSNVNTYTVHGYRVSLQKMEGFLSQLRPEVVFRRFGDEPALEVHQVRLDHTRRNLEVAVQYLQLKLVSIGMLEALSLRIGPDVALAAMMGNHLDANEQTLLLEQYLPQVTHPYRAQNATEACVMELLETGRSADSVHDTRHSPVANYLVKSHGMAAVMALLPFARAFFKDPQQAETLLQACTPETLSTLQQAAAKVFEQRAQSLVTPHLASH